MSGWLSVHRDISSCRDPRRLSQMKVLFPRAWRFMRINFLSLSSSHTPNYTQSLDKGHCSKAVPEGKLEPWNILRLAIDFSHKNLKSRHFIVYRRSIKNKIMETKDNQEKLNKTTYSTSSNCSSTHS